MASPGIRIAILLCTILVAIPVQAQLNPELREGDLIFCCSESGNAITTVTSGVDSLLIDHVAVVHRIGGESGLLFVIEAVKPTVCLTPLQSFLEDNHVMLLGRFNGGLDIKKTIKRCLSMVGKPYDDLYLPGDSAVYCSELVQLSYTDSSGRLVFDPIPMSFHDRSGEVTDYWKEFYCRRGMMVPEGAPGTNPGELSRRSQVTILGEIYNHGGRIVFERH